MLTDSQGRGNHGDNGENRVGAGGRVVGDGRSVLDREVRKGLPAVFFSIDLKVE